METQLREIIAKTFKSDIRNLSIAESLVDSVFSTNQNIKEDHYGNILIAVTEAVNNAIQHGNGGDDSKNVSISALMNDKELRIVIQDEGKGFNFDSLPDPTAPENIEKETGRGIFLMKSLTDEVIFEDGGSKVILVFVL